MEKNETPKERGKIFEGLSPKVMSIYKISNHNYVLGKKIYFSRRYKF